MAVKTCLDKMGGAIAAELYLALEAGGAPEGLLVIVGSWGDTVDDADILLMIQQWNEPPQTQQ